MKKYLIVFLFLTLTLNRYGSAQEHEYKIMIKDHHFVPAELRIPANLKVKIHIENLDSEAEEFESYDLDREKIVGPNKTITVFLGPLKPGFYKYFGEFNPDTAQGVIVAE